MRRKLPNKISAFTLSEMLVVLLLTTLVVGIGFSILNLLHRHFESVRSHLQANSEWDLLEERLLLDLHKYPQASWNGGLKIVTFSSPLESKTLVVSENTIIYNGDTLAVSGAHITCFNRGYEIQDGLLDAVKLEWMLEKQHRAIFVHTTMDSKGQLRSDQWISRK